MDPFEVPSERTPAPARCACRVPLHDCCADLAFQLPKERSMSRAISPKRPLVDCSGRKLDSGGPGRLFFVTARVVR